MRTNERRHSHYYNVIATICQTGIGGPVSNDRSSPNLGDGQNPYDRSIRGEISDEEYDRLQDEYLERLNALEAAFEQNAIEAAERYMRARERENFAFYGNDFEGSPWD